MLHTFGGVTVPVKVICRRNAKNIHFYVDLLRQSVTVTSPRLHTEAQMKKMLSPHQDWIHERLSHHNPVILQDGMSLPVLEKEVCLRLTQDRKDKRVELVEDALICRSLVPNPSVARFLQEELLSYLEKRVPLFSERINVQVSSLRVKNTRTRWGSCSQNGTLSFQWKLVFAPLNILDYVIIHEACHLRHFNHSPEFWSLVSELDPNFQKHRRWLKEHGDSLLAYFPHGS